MKDKYDIIVTTGDLKQDYEIIDIVSAYETDDINTPCPPLSVGTVVDSMKEACLGLKGDAVIHCTFTNIAIRDDRTDGVYFFGYGTAVKFI